LREIRDGHLYEGYDTFKQYVEDRWQISEQHAYRLMDASVVRENLEKSIIVDFLPTSERQVRPLTRLEPAQQCEVWEEVQRRYGEKDITATITHK
jgi:hypothetical protein